MKNVRVLPIILGLTSYVILLVLTLAGCATESQIQGTNTQTVDKPTISVQDAISIAQQHSVTSPLNVYESRAGVYAKRGGTTGWSGQYNNSGKWTVELRVKDDEGVITVYRWSVFESNLSAAFLGAFQ